MNVGSIQMLTNTVFLAVTMVVIFLSVIAYDMFNYFSTCLAYKTSVFQTH